MTLKFVINMVSCMDFSEGNFKDTLEVESWLQYNRLINSTKISYYHFLSGIYSSPDLHVLKIS